MIKILSRIRVVMYKVLVQIVAWKYRFFYGIDIGEGTVISWRARLERNINPKGIHIGSYTRITGGVKVLTHDDCRKMKADTWIGNNVFIGIHSLILPGVKIGNSVIIGAGSVVTKDIPDNCIAAGNPARIIREGVKCGHYGVIEFQEE